MDWQVQLVIALICLVIVAFVGYVSYWTFRVYSVKMNTGKWPAYRKWKVRASLILGAALTVAILGWFYVKVLPAIL